MSLTGLDRPGYTDPNAYLRKHQVGNDLNERATPGSPGHTRPTNYQPPAPPGAKRVSSPLDALAGLAGGGGGGIAGPSSMSPPPPTTPTGSGMALGGLNAVGSPAPDAINSGGRNLLRQDLGYRQPPSLQALLQGVRY